MQKNKKDKLLKEIHQAEERIRELQEEIRNKPKTPLQKKIFAGHWRSFSVRADVLRSSIGNQIAKIVDACNTFRFGKKKDPESFRGCTEIAIPNPPNHLTQFHPNQGLKSLSKEDFEKLDLSPKQKEKWFLEVSKTLRVGSKNISIPRYFPQIPTHMLEFCYKPAYITEVTVPDGDKESELIRLYQFMTKTNGWEKLYGSYKDEWDTSETKKRLLKRIQQKEIQEELNPP